MIRRLRANLFVRSLEDRTAPAIFSVLNLNDSGANSLRDCVAKANAAAGTDTINFSGSLSGTITLTSGEIAISQAVTIDGPTSPALTISGNSASRIFNISTAPADARIEINDLTLTKAKGTGEGGAILGGDELLVLIRCNFTSNTSTFSGGAVCMIAGPNFSATDCMFTNNTANAGGALSLFGPVATTDIFLIRSNFSGNKAAGGGGGAAWISGDLLMDDSTMSGNTATASGGGAMRLSNYYDTSAVFIIRNSTISGNSATGSGGISMVDFKQSLNLRNCTVVNNAATTGSGGGIGVATGATGVINIESSIISGNTATKALDISSGGTVNQKSSAVGSSSGFTKTDQGGNLPFQAHANLKLGALTNNGGPTFTHMPGQGSPLIDAGFNAANTTNDQRSAGFPRQFGTQTDIGSVEGFSVLVTNAKDAGSGSLRQTIQHANAKSGTDTITFDPIFFSTSQFIILTTGELVINQSVTIVGPTGEVLVDGNKLARVFNTSGSTAGSTLTLENVNLVNGKSGGFGGAIGAVDENIVLRNCSISSSVASSGGAISISGPGASLLIEDSFVFNNEATSNAGGAIFLGNDANVTIRRSTISVNKAGNSGGGLYFFDDGSLTIEDSTISGNKAESKVTAVGGGGICFFGVASKFFISNSTLSGNSAPNSNGGAIALGGFAGTATFQNATIANNSAGLNGGGIARLAGGLLSFTSTIVAGNINAKTPDLSCDTATNIGGDNNLIGVADVGGFTLTGKNNLAGTLAKPLDAKLEPLATFGGPTPTHMPRFDSPALNAGSNPAGLVNDQRGVGFPRVAGAATDIGAVERPTLVVTNTNDSGVGSLRQVVLDADILPGADTVTFDPVVFATPQTIKLTTGEISIEDAATILGPVGRVTIDGDAKSRIFTTTDAANGSLIELVNLNMVNGSETSSGGAVEVAEQWLMLRSSSISNCSAGFGGAISALSFTVGLIVEDSTLSNNQAKNTGGAIHAPGIPVTIRRSTLSGNTAQKTGGGLYMNGGTLLIENSTLSGNTASSLTTGTGGGGIFFVGNPMQFLISNSTLSGNSAAMFGGAVCFSSFDGVATFQNCTVTQNSVAGGGGGIARTSGSGNLLLDSTIVAQNINFNAPDFSFNSPTNLFGSNNLIGVADLGNFTLNGSGNQSGTNSTPLKANLGALADNGGPTLTHLPLTGSPAINKGSNPAALTFDQRGLPRVSQGITDVGAVEVQLLAPSKISTIQINDGAAHRSRVTSVTINFDSIVSFSGVVASAFQLKRQSDNASPNFTATAMNGTVTTVTLTAFSGSATDFGSLADGRYTLTVLASQINNFDGNGDGIAGDNFVRIGTPANGLIRLFGDANGDGIVNAFDFAQFRPTFGGTSPIFDFDNDGNVGTVDFNQFRTRFGASV